MPPVSNLYAKKQGRQQGEQLGQFALGPTLLGAPGGGRSYIIKKIKIL